MSAADHEMKDVDSLKRRREDDQMDRMTDDNAHSLKRMKMQMVSFKTDAIMLSKKRHHDEDKDCQHKTKMIKRIAAEVIEQKQDNGIDQTRFFPLFCEQLRQTIGSCKSKSVHIERAQTEENHIRNRGHRFDCFNKYVLEFVSGQRSIHSYKIQGKIVSDMEACRENIETMYYACQQAASWTLYEALSILRFLFVNNLDVVTTRSINDEFPSSVYLNDRWYHILIPCVLLEREGDVRGYNHSRFNFHMDRYDSADGYLIWDAIQKQKQYIASLTCKEYMTHLAQF